MAFASPNYPRNYPDNLNICWPIYAGRYYPIISFPHFDTDDNDLVRVYDGDTTSSTLLLAASGVYVGGYVRNVVVSSTDQMLVVFTADDKSSSVGFQAQYSFCWVPQFDRGTISSPDYPNSYDNFAVVCWVINPPAGFVVSLFFNQLALGSGDYVRIFDGTSTNSPVLINLYGTTVPSLNRITSSSNVMLVIFSSDYIGYSTGFRASYNSVLVG